MKWSLGMANFLEEISSISHSIVCLYFLALITEEGFLISPCYSLECYIQMGISFLFSFSPLLYFSAICKASSDNHFAFLHFFFLGMVLITASCTMSRTSGHSSSGALSYLIPWIFLSLPLYNCSIQFSQFSRSVVSNSLQPHESQHARPPCPSPTPGGHSWMV